jgi:hypothetical protein
MKVFIATMIAGRQTDVASIGMSARTLLVIQTDEQAARHEAEAAFYRDHPIAEGWKEHQVTIFELPPEVEDGGYRLTWTLEKLP